MFKKLRPEVIILNLSLGFMVVFFASALCYSIYQLQTKQKCLEKGYPKYQIDYTLTRYCIKRVEQTDQVTPLKNL